MATINSLVFGTLPIMKFRRACYGFTGSSLAEADLCKETQRCMYVQFMSVFKDNLAYQTFANDTKCTLLMIPNLTKIF